MSLWQSNMVCWKMMETAPFSSKISPAIFPWPEMSDQRRVSFPVPHYGDGQNPLFPLFGAVWGVINSHPLYHQLWLRDLVWAPGFWLSSPHRNFASSDSRPAAKLLAKQYLSNLALVPWVLQNIFHGIERGGLGGEDLSLSFKLLIRLGNDKPLLRTY